MKISQPLLNKTPSLISFQKKFQISVISIPSCIKHARVPSIALYLFRKYLLLNRGYHSFLALAKFFKKLTFLSFSENFANILNRYIYNPVKHLSLNFQQKQSLTMSAKAHCMKMVLLNESRIFKTTAKRRFSTESINKTHQKLFIEALVDVLLRVVSVWGVTTTKKDCI